VVAELEDTIRILIRDEHKDDRTRGRKPVQTLTTPFTSCANAASTVATAAMSPAYL
jgi:hypothetical protein